MNTTLNAACTGLRTSTSFVTETTSATVSFAKDLACVSGVSLPQKSRSAEQIITISQH